MHKLHPWVLLDIRRLEGPEVSKVAQCTVELQLPIPDVKRLRQPVGGLAYLCALSTAPGAQAEVAAYMQLQSLTHRQIEEQLQPGCGVQANSPGSSTLSLHKGGCWYCSLRPIHVHDGLQTSVYGRRMGDNARWIEAAENPTTTRSVTVTLVMVQQFIVMSGTTIQQHLSLFTPLSTGVCLQYQQHHCQIVTSPPFCEVSALFNHCQAWYA